MKGFCVMIDGIDGSGKGTAVKALGEWAQQEGKRVFDLREFQKEHGRHPEPHELDNYDVILSGEPTYTWTGMAIREEMVKSNGREYHPLQIAEGFSSDRGVLYRRVILPALEKGKIIFQERGNVTSLAYQPLDAKVRKNIDISYQEIMQLPGNEFTFLHPPDLLIITTCEPETAMDRLGKREKKDGAIFEELNFLTELSGVYESEWLRKVYEQLGTQVIFLDTGSKTTPDDTKANAITVWEEFLDKTNRIKEVSP